MIGAHLLVFAAMVAWAAPRVLPRAGWVYRSPLLGIAAWYAVLAAVVSAVAAALVSLAAPWQRGDAPVCVAWRWCLQAWRGDFGAAGRAAAVAALLVGLGLAVRLVVVGARLIRAAAARRGQHLRLLALAGRPSAELGATVVLHAQPAAYVVAGRGRRVVVTTGALDALSGDELAAVLAHERAHAAGRHDLLLDGVRVLRQAFPAMAVFATAYVELRWLVEMRADEVAATRHSRLSLARALVVMASATDVGTPAPGSPAPVPHGAVAVTGGDAVQRLHRLLAPPDPLSRGHRTVLVAAVALLAVGPAALLVTAQFLPVLSACPTLPG